MERSLIAKERYIENKIYSGEYIEDEFYNKDVQLRAEVRKMSEEEIVGFIQKIGIKIDKEKFKEDVKGFYSAEKYCRYLMDESNVESYPGMQEALWRRILILWERWTPTIPNFEKIDDVIQLGYGFIEMHHSEKVIDMWMNAWRDIKVLMKRHKFKDINVLNEKYRGSEDLIAWGSDFEGEAYNAGIKNEKYFLRRMDFCMEFLNRNKELREITRENMKRAIAESLFCIGDFKAGEALFEKYLIDDPQWGWGWIGWSDCYWMIGKRENKNYKMAEKILLRGLKVEGLREYEDVYERLIRVRFKMGRKSDRLI